MGKMRAAPRPKFLALVIYQMFRKGLPSGWPKSGENHGNSNEK